MKYIAEFPLRIQESLARVGYVECYEPKRFIVKEGGAPENAYIVLYGSSKYYSLIVDNLNATSNHFNMRDNSNLNILILFQTSPTHL